MSRPKAFEPELALDCAVDAFWRSGYEKTSLDALMRETGVARQSLYDTFGDKRALYLASLARYRDSSHAALRRILTPGRPVREGFAEILLGLCGESKASLERGCLLLSANLERAHEDREVAALLRANQAAIETIFADALRRAQAAGELPADMECGALARFFVATLQGMRAMARVRPDRAALEQVARIALRALD
jgi:TetR/AcrR family transcriptional repressor of nem operon